MRWSIRPQNVSRMIVLSRRVKSGMVESSRCHFAPRQTGQPNHFANEGTAIGQEKHIVRSRPVLEATRKALLFCPLVLPRVLDNLAPPLECRNLIILEDRQDRLDRAVIRNVVTDDRYTLSGVRQRDIFPKAVIPRRGPDTRAVIDQFDRMHQDAWTLIRRDLPKELNTVLATPPILERKVEEAARNPNPKLCKRDEVGTEWIDTSRGASTDVLVKIQASDVSKYIPPGEGAQR